MGMESETSPIPSCSMAQKSREGMWGCPLIQDPTAWPKGMVPTPVPAEPHPPRDTTRLTFTL